MTHGKKETTPQLCVIVRNTMCCSTDKEIGIQLLPQLQPTLNNLCGNNCPFAIPHQHQGRERKTFLCVCARNQTNCDSFAMTQCT